MSEPRQPGPRPAATAEHRGPTDVGPRDERWLWLGMAAWLVAIVARWPVALSISDEVAYVAQAKLLLEGHMAPYSHSPGIWHLGVHGLAPLCYPYLIPILIAPLVALTPRLVFLLGVGSALAITWVAGRALRSWGRRPIWALIVLAHPTVILISRTVMADLALSAFLVGAWWAIHNDKRIATLILLVMVVASKAIGFPIAAALVGGEALRCWRPLLARDRTAIAHLAWAIAGVLLGLLLVVSLNYASSGKLWYSYDYEFLGGPPFQSKFISVSAPKHLRTLLFAPPLLFLGALPFWRRREFGPLLVTAGIATMMSMYFFVDRGRNSLETMILSPRLILPAVSFLLIGYADLLAGLAARLPSLRPAQAPLLIGVPALIGLVISVRHHRMLEPNAAALAAATTVASQAGETELGLTESAFKAGMLFNGRTSSVEGNHRPGVILCNTRSASYRKPEYAIRCELPGYDARVDGDGFRVLVRRASGSSGSTP